MSDPTPEPEAPAAPSAPEAPAVESSPEPVVESSVPEVPPEQPAQETPVPDSTPNPPAWMSRHYISRAFGFTWFGIFIQGSFYQLAGGSIDCDGLYGTTEFDSTSDLTRLAGGDQDALVTKVRSMLSR